MVCGCKVVVYVVLGPCLCAGYHVFARQFDSREGTIVSQVFVVGLGGG